MKKIPGAFRGLTLIEMILYVGLCSFLLMSLATSSSFLLKARIKNQTMSEVNQSGIQILQIMTQVVRNAKSINTPTLGSSSSTLSIKTNSSSTDPTIFDVASGTFRIKEGTSTYEYLTNNKVLISSFTATNTSIISSSTEGGSVDFSFTLSYISQSSSTEYTAKKTFSGSASFH